LVGIENSLSVEGNVRAPRGPRAAGDQYELPPKRLCIAVLLESYRVPIDKFRRAVVNDDAVSFQLSGNDFGFALDNGADSGR